MKPWPSSPIGNDRLEQDGRMGPLTVAVVVWGEGTGQRPQVTGHRRPHVTSPNNPNLNTISTWSVVHGHTTRMSVTGHTQVTVCS